MRIRKGIVFNLRLPGFERTRNLFARPVSTMQNVFFYPQGHIIFREGDIGTEFYLLKKGRVRFFKKSNTGEKISMGHSDKGGIFGELSVLSGNARAATAVCETDTVVAKADSDNLDALIRNNVEFAHTLMQSLADNMKKSEDILIEKMNQIESQKMETERLFHTTLLIALIGIGYNPEKGNISDGIDINKLSVIIKNMGDSEVHDLINIMMHKKDSGESGSNQVQERISFKLNEIYNRLKDDGAV